MWYVRYALHMLKYDILIHMWISVSLNKEQFLPSLIARLMNVKSRLSSCSISSKLTSSPGTGPVEDPLGGNYLVILHSSFALETDKLSYSKKSSRSSVGVLSSLKIFRNRESWDSPNLVKGLESVFCLGINPTKERMRYSINSTCWYSLGRMLG